MLNTVYRLRAPRQFEIAFEDVPLDREHIIVRPTFLSICNADQRYYQGLRPESVLRQKLPMALIHEGIGRVVYDPTDTFTPGTDVIMIPNLPVETDPVAGENYLRSSRFRGSGTDGFLQEYIRTEADRLVPLPADINPAVAAFTELVSVSLHAIRRMEQIAHSRREVIGVWGDGNLGYITSLLWKTVHPESRVIVFGKNRMKLADFTFADEICTIEDIPGELEVDHAFECVGGNASARAVNQIIDRIRPEGSISLLGVSEDPAPLNTRMVLEKGLRLFGSSRSAREDFLAVAELYAEHPEVTSYLENIVGSVITVRSLADISRAFETDIHKLIGKTVMEWEE